MKHNEIILTNHAHPRLTANTTTSTSNGTAILYVDTGPGYIELGPANSAHCHIQTDRTNFYFNKELRVDSGVVGSYDEDLILRRANNTSHQIQIGTDYIASSLPLELSHESGGAATAGGRFLHAKYSGNNRIAVFSSQYGSGNLLIGNGMAYDTGANQIVSTFANFSGSRTGLNVQRGNIVFLGTTGAIQTTVDSAITTQETFLHQTTDGYTRIGTTTGTQNSRLAIYKADNDVADHIIFYNGNTRVGEIGVLDNSWLRLNQTTANNIYTPRLLRADGGLYTTVGSATNPTFAIQNDNNTGMYSPGSDQLAFTTGGTRRVNISTSAINFYLDATAPYFNGTSGFKVNQTEVFDGNRVLKNVTRADFANFSVTGTSTTQVSYLRYGNISANTEGSHMSHPYFFNDLANFAARGGTVTLGGLNTTAAMTKPFDASPDFAGWAASNYTGSTMTITLTSLPKSLNYGGYIGIAFGNTGWAPASCKIEISTDGGSTWTTRLNDSSKKEIYFTTIGTGASGANAIRFTLGQPTSYLRITNIWAYNYNSAGMEEYFLSKGGGRVWGDVGIGSNVEAGSKLKLYNNGDTKMTIECNDSSSAYINFTGTSNEMSLGYDRANSRMAFTNHDTLGSNIRMILKSGGDWAVSNTDARVATQFSDQAGIGWYETNQNMQVATTSASNPAMEIGLNHSTSNAPFINFRKQGTLRGSISLEGNDSLLIQSTGSTGAGLRFHPSSGVISPIRNGSVSNETISLGALTQSFNTAFVKKGYFHGGKNPQSGTWGGDPFVIVGGFESTGNHDGSDAMANFSLGVVSIGNNGGNSVAMRKNQVWTTGGVSGQAYNSSARWDLGRWEDNATNSRSRLDLYLADQSHGWYLTSSWKVDGGSPRLGVGTTSPEDTLHVNGGSYATYFTGAAASDKNRYRFYGTSTSYTIGMVSGLTFGGLGGWGMAFNFSNNAERGFVWKDDGHGVNGGAMAVTTEGKLTVAHSARIGYGETDTTTPGATYRLDVAGNGQFSASNSDQTTSNDSTSVPSTSGSAIMRWNGGYTDGRYATEFVKVDRIGNLPLYIRESTGTANSFSNVARFGAHANTGDSTRANRFYVFGDMGAAGDATFTGDIQAGISSSNGNRFHVKVLGYDASIAYDVAMKTHYDSVYGRAGQIATTNAAIELNTEQSNNRIVIKPGTGMVGINNDTPQRKLTVTEGSAGSASDNSGILSLTVGSGANTDSKLAFGIDSSHQGWIHVVKPGTNVYPLVLNPTNSSNGRIGIGKSPSSGYHLDVNGSIAVRGNLDIVQGSLMMSGQHAIREKTYSGTGNLGASGAWYTLCYITENNTPAYISLKYSAHSTQTFVVTMGYHGSNVAHIQMLSSTWTQNGAYPHASAVRILKDSNNNYRFQLQLTYSSGPSGFSLDARAWGNTPVNDIISFESSLTVDTTTGSTIGSLNTSHTGSASSMAHRQSSGNSTTPGYTFHEDSNTGMYRSGPDQIGFTTNGTARAHISNTKLTLEDGMGLDLTTSSGNVRGLFLASETAPNLRIATSSNESIGFYDGGTSGVLNVEINGAGALTVRDNVTAYGSFSDIRLKENIEVIPDAVQKIQKLEGVTFNYKKDGSRSAGLIAQQLQEVLPEVVYETKDLDTQKTHYAVRYGNVVGLLVEAIKEQQTQLTAQQEQINQLTTLVNKLMEK